jgi:YgiT-type zinc finger domain-containing protein
MKCYKDEGEMVPVVIDYEHQGVVVKGVKALKCQVCGEEVIDVEEYGKIRRRIESIVKPLRLRRKISSAGNRPAVYLPDDVVRAVKVEIGDDVEIYVEGNRIIIEPVS